MMTFLLGVTVGAAMCFLAAYIATHAPVHEEPTLIAQMKAVIKREA